MIKTMAITLADIWLVYNYDVSICLYMYMQVWYPLNIQIFYL